MKLNWIIYIAVAVVALAIIMFLVINSVKKRNRLKAMDALQDRIGTLKALPVQYLLNKVSLMPKTDEIESKYETWNADYQRLSNEENIKIKENINEVEELIYARKYKKALENIHELDKYISSYEKEYEALHDELSLATQVDVRNREEITNQKELFRNYKKMYQSNLDNYKPYNQAIERYFDNIEDAFTNIDVLLNQSQVDNARTKASALEVELLKMKDILNNLPLVLVELTKDLPNRYKEVEQRYNEIVVKKYNLSQLEVPKRLQKVNREIVDVLSNNDDIFLKDLQDTSLYAHRDLDEIMENLDYEVRANEQLDKVVKDLIEVSIDTDLKCKEANQALKEVKEYYFLTNNEEENLNMETDVLSDLLVEKNDIVSKHMSTNYVASELEQRVRILIPKFNLINMAIKAYLERISNLRADEKRLYDEYNNMLYIIRDCEARLGEMNLPMLSQSYYSTITECKNGLSEVLSLLNGKPLNIDLINGEVARMCEVVYKLYDNARNLLKTAQMAENTIIFGNRYRTTRPEVESMLNRAEIFFNNGEYTKSLSTAIEAIESIYPSIRTELIKYRSDQVKGNSYA